MCIESKAGLASSLVVSGVVLANSLSKVNNENLKMLGAVLFLLGWALLAYCVVNKNRLLSLPNLANLLGIVLVVVAVMMMKLGKSRSKHMKKVAGAMFVAGWAVLSVSLALRNNGSLNRVVLPYSVAGAALVLLSMVVVLPKQRKWPSDASADGPGMVLFTVGWMLVALAVSKR